MSVPVPVPRPGPRLAPPVRRQSFLPDLILTSPTPPLIRQIPLEVQN
ncbi:MAG: hypothetical protein AB7P13_09210 [Candidatus Nitrosocosmicus sp.]